MQFAIIAFDGTDEQAPARRMQNRAAHIALSDDAVTRGEQVIGAALLDDNGAMRGSVMIVDFPSRQELDAWLAKEPYVLGKVWERIEIHACKVGPSFVPFLKK